MQPLHIYNFGGQESKITPTASEDTRSFNMQGQDAIYTLKPNKTGSNEQETQEKGDQTWQNERRLILWLSFEYGRTLRISLSACWTLDFLHCCGWLGFFSKINKLYVRVEFLFPQETKLLSRWHWKHRGGKIFFMFWGIVMLLGSEMLCFTLYANVSGLNKVTANSVFLVWILRGKKTSIRDLLCSVYSCTS